MQKWLMHAIGLLARAGGPLVVLLLFVPAAVAAAAAGPTEPAYAGPEECAQCHVAEGAAWQASSHASAQDSIASAGGRL
jgi:mono/diheme cytochrome c family protein